MSEYLLTEKTNTLAVFFAETIQERQFSEYLEETYTEDDDPINQFAADLGSWFYDHDDQEAVFFAEPKPVDDFLEGASWFESYNAAVVSRLKELGVTSVQATVLLFDHQFLGSSLPDSSPLTFAGNFGFEKS
ncbi:MAG: immunity 22 family protein [Myxococcota bacterium]